MVKFKSLNLTAVIIVALLLIAGLWIAYFIQKSSSQESTVTANGDTQLSVLADQVSVYLLVQTKADSAETAKNDNAAIWRI